MMRKAFGKMILLIVSLMPGAIFAQQAVDGIEGLDPVLLVRGEEKQGELNIAVVRGRFRYLFANEANKALFEKDPARYEIQLEGHCARMGAPVRGIADLYAVHEGRIYIFGSEQCKTLFVGAPEKYLEAGDAPKFSATPEAMKKGSALIEKAMAGIGGARVLDGLTSYHEKSVSSQIRGRNGEIEVTVTNELLIVFPDRIRFTQTMPDFRDNSRMMEQTLVLLPGDEFGLGGPRGVFPIQKSYRDAEENRILLQPLHILRARNSPGFKTAALGADRIGGTEVERVAVEWKDGMAVLAIDPATGRIVSLSQRRRGQQGAYGESVRIFSDFRSVGGLTLPFKITATFDGKPWKEQTSTIESIALNAAIEPKLFERPKKDQ